MMFAMNAKYVAKPPEYVDWSIRYSVQSGRFLAARNLRFHWYLLVLHHGHTDLRTDWRSQFTTNYHP